MAGQQEAEARAAGAQEALQQQRAAEAHILVCIGILAQSYTCTHSEPSEAASVDGRWSA